jgi:hypothetical protein
METPWSALPEVPLQPVVSADGLDAAERARLRREGMRAQAAIGVLKQEGLNLVSAILRDQGPFYEMNHYPDDDVFDPESASQYYYHAHREGEHGHFHTFVRRRAMPDMMRPAAGFQRSEPLPPEKDELAHLVCISMDVYGLPQGLFAVNRWVSDETWYSAGETVALVDKFLVGHAFPHFAVNQWLSAFVALCRPQVEALLHHRDAVIEAWRNEYPERDVLEDRELEMTGYLPVEMSQLITALGK